MIQIIINEVLVLAFYLYIFEESFYIGDMHLLKLHFIVSFCILFGIYSWMKSCMYVCMLCMSYLVGLFDASCKIVLKIKSLDLNQTRPTKNRKFMTKRGRFLMLISVQLELTQNSFGKSTRSNDHSLLYFEGTQNTKSSKNML